jgi:hypothetical protein
LARAAPEPATTPQPAAAVATEQPRRPETSTAPAKAAPASGLGGNWFYAADLDTAPGSARYKPVYVELLLSQTGDALAGNYRALYSVPDRAISTQVVFHLEGKVGPDQRAKLGWTGVNGSKGLAEITLVPGGIMDFHWWSTELPKEATLSSGRARLVRQRQP